MLARPAAKSACVAGAWSLIAFAALAVRLMNGLTIPGDSTVLEQLRHSVPGAERLVLPLAVLGPVITVVAVTLLVRRRRFEDAVFWFAAVGGALVLDPLAKNIVGRSSLNAASDGYSFPSGSAMGLLATVLAIAITLPAARRPVIALGLSVLVVAQGAILVSTRWHYPSDVLGGWCLAVGWLTFIWLAVRGTSALLGQHAAENAIDSQASRGETERFSLDD